MQHLSKMSRAISRNKSARIMIVSDPQDYHSLAVSNALKLKGAEHGFWYLADYPTQQTGSSWIGPGVEHWEIAGPGCDSFRGMAPSTIWMRRPGQPVLPSGIATVDHPVAYRECRAFLNGLQQQVGAGSFWVNSPASFLRATSKLEQLRAAVRCGFRVPGTLMSNDPRHICDFLAAQSGRAVYKSFYPALWVTGSGVAASFSTPLSVEDLPDDETLRATPGIYQAIVPKLFELRITIMGRQIFAARIDSQSVPSACFDWRAARERVPIVPFELPEALAAACYRLMEDLGLVFGCLDLIVTPDLEYVFLEINEMGAFLWIEEHNPEIRLLSPFCEFLLQGRPDFVWDPATTGLRLEDVHHDAVRDVHRAATEMRHVLRPPAAMQE